MRGEAGRLQILILTRVQSELNDSVGNLGRASLKIKSKTSLGILVGEDLSNTNDDLGSMSQSQQHTTHTGTHRHTDKHTQRHTYIHRNMQVHTGTQRYNTYTQAHTGTYTERCRHTDTHSDTYTHT